MQSARQRVILVMLLITALSSAACGSPQPQPMPTATATSVPTKAPTATCTSTSTPSPTSTPTEAPSLTPTDTPSPTPLPLTEWTEKATITFDAASGEPSEASTQSFCVRGADGAEHWVQLGTCGEARLPGRACPGLCHGVPRPKLGGTIPLLIDGKCMTFYAGPAFDPVTYDLGGGTQVILSTQSSTAAGDIIVVQFVGALCEDASQ